VNIQASLSFLNLSQNILLQACLASGLVLSIFGFRKRSSCCISRGCPDGLGACCSTLEPSCSGMEIGDFVTVLTYTINLFVPLNFLGSVYNAVIMAFIDLRNLSELLAENPDITDSPNAVDLPTDNLQSPDVAIEFENVSFHYPTQPESKGLKGVSFKLKRGTTTGLVGTTVSDDEKFLFYP
jgi:ABC-type multidrug transport system fused ATPase/permease subunit